MSINIRKTGLFVWNIIDPIYFHFTRLDYVENKFGNRTIMRVRLTKYKGRKVTLSDGTEINKNDLLLKIHLHNIKILGQIQDYDSEVRRALAIYKTVQESLPEIAHYIQIKGYTNEIKGLIGITMLHKGCKKLGFEIYSIHNRYYKLFKQVTLLPIHLLSSNKIKKKIPSPIYLFMSKDRLFEKYKRV
ncbi:YkoP family protein [Virgibacillus proomii]|jgi:hypothetical protein|uniref:YkoP family protein n=1 Tax=Virgibacillus proomii TaxID=84407 RepID=UPI001FE30E1A|nr:hypothetical protein [Virgibacillus proomii]